MIGHMFIVVGLVGAVLLLTSRLGADFLDDLVPELPAFSGRVIGAGFLGFGFVGWFVGAVLDSAGPIALLAAIAGAVLAAAMAGQAAGGSRSA